MRTTCSGLTIVVVALLAGMISARIAVAQSISQLYARYHVPPTSSGATLSGSSGNIRMDSMLSHLRMPFQYIRYHSKSGTNIIGRAPKMVGRQGGISLMADQSARSVRSRVPTVSIVYASNKVIAGTLNGFFQRVEGHLWSDTVFFVYSKRYDRMLVLYVTSLSRNDSDDEWGETLYNYQRKTIDGVAAYSFGSRMEIESLVTARPGLGVDANVYGYRQGEFVTHSPPSVLPYRDAKSFVSMSADRVFGLILSSTYQHPRDILWIHAPICQNLFVRVLASNCR